MKDLFCIIIIIFFCRITRASVVPESFHARFCVQWRSYLYRLAIVKPEVRITFPEVQSFEEFLPISLLNRCHIVP